MFGTFDPTAMATLDAALRWLHVVAGIVWMGQLFFFNLVNAVMTRDWDGETKRKILPQLLPRALYFFRWGALITWVSGLLLIGLVYHLGGLMVAIDVSAYDKWVAFTVTQGLIFFGFFLYDGIWRVLGKAPPLAAGVSLALFVGVARTLSALVTGRALWLHLGAILGSVMMFNVWMRIWPAQKKLIRGLKETGPTPGPEVAALAAQRSRHNLYLSVPVVCLMATVHTFTLAYGDDYNWVWATGVVIVGAALAKLLLLKADSAAPLKAP